MNPIIERHFESIESELLCSPSVISYQIIRQEIAPTDGKLRLKMMLSNGGSVELFEYVAEVKGIIYLLKYSFHWQDELGHLERRWDNAPHYPDLPNAPHHVHNRDGTVKEVSQPPDLFSIIRHIEESLTHFS